jgi:hypothetical protein
MAWWLERSMAADGCGSSSLRLGKSWNHSTIGVRLASKLDGAVQTVVGDPFIVRVDRFAMEISLSTTVVFLHGLLCCGCWRVVNAAPRRGRGGLASRWRGRRSRRVAEATIHRAMRARAVRSGWNGASASEWPTCAGGGDGVLHRASSRDDKGGMTF